MAWVNRTTRDQGPCMLAAAAHLGPGSYETSPMRRVRPNAAAFGSSAEPERGTGGPGSPGTIGHTFVTPGPGAYGEANQAQWESPTKTQSSVFQSTTDREAVGKSNNATPGPGAYIKPDVFGVKKKKPQETSNSFLQKDTPKTNKIKWARLPSAPSIPTHAQSFGYEQGAHGKLVRHEPAHVGHSGRGDDTLGPGEYDPMRGLKSIHKPRATDFSRSKVTRSLEQEIKQKAELPGPGQYNDPPAASASKQAQRSSAVFKSAITREKALQSESKQPIPGPGSYFEGYKGFTGVSKPDHLQFFGSTSTRFEPHQIREMQSPGPGAYYSPPAHTARDFAASRRLGKSAPFSSKKERFNHGTSKEEYAAAPGSYNMPSAMSETLGKVSSRVHSFGSTTKRFDSLSQPHEQVPETAESQLEREMKSMHEEPSTATKHPGTNKQKSAKMTSVFASSSTRFKPLQKTSSPSPGDYQVQSSWNAPGATGTFKSATDRLKQKSIAGVEVPGPGHYTTPPAINQKPVHMARPDVFFGAEPRFKQTLPKVQVPGPGQYSTQSVENEWNRPTYNITIATEMELAMLR